MNSQPNRFHFALFKFISLAIVFCLFSSPAFAEQFAPPKAIKGILDLQSWDFEKNGTVPLIGEWEFYWQEQIAPMDFDFKHKDNQVEYINLPRLWNGYNWNGKELGGSGFATFKLTVVLPETEKMLGLKLMDFNTAGRLFVDGVLMAESGTPGKNAESTEPYLKPQVVEFINKGKNLELVIHLSNFHDRIGGVRQAIMLGTATQVVDLRDGSLVFEFVLFGSIFIMALYHLGLYLLRRKGVSALYFSLFCFLIALRTLLTGERYLMYISSWINWHLAVKIEILCFYLAVPAFAMFVKEVFSWKFSAKLLKGIKLFSLIASGLIVVLPVKYGTETLPTYQGFTLLVIGYSIYVIVMSIIKKKEGAIVFAFGFSLLILTVVNDILYDLKIINTGFWVPFGVFMFIFSQAFLLSARFSKAFQRVELLSEELGEKSEELSIKNIELQNHKDNLEQKVEERTESIKVLLDNTGQGFLTFDPQYQIDPIYSKACQVFFSESLAKKDSLSLLSSNSGFQDEKKLKEMLDMVFQGISSVELFDDLLPNELNVDGRILKCDYRLIPPAGTIKEHRVMLILTDVTRERELAEQLKTDEERKEIIVKIAIDKAGFIEFINEMNGQFASLKELLSNKPEKIDLDAIFRVVHTIKGGAGSYALKSVTQAAHEIESNLDQYRTGEVTLDSVCLNKINGSLTELEQNFHETLENFNNIISGEELKTKERNYQISNSKIEQLKQFLQSIVPEDQREKLNSQLYEICKQPVGPILRRYKRTAEDLAVKMSKSVQVNLTGVETSLSLNHYDQLFSTLVHLVRNSVDHGLEDPDIRSMTGKPSRGNLDIDVKLLNGVVRIQIADDGQGIDVDHIKNIAVSKGVINEEEAKDMTEEKVLELIFHPGFSTADKISDVSGRGVGMDAVKSIVDELEGKLSIQTEVGKGTTFTVEVPNR